MFGTHNFSCTLPGTGVEKLLKLLGLSLDSALACGDAENDVEMLKMVAQGYLEIIFVCPKPEKQQNI